MGAPRALPAIVPRAEHHVCKVTVYNTVDPSGDVLQNAHKTGSALGQYSRRMGTRLQFLAGLGRSAVAVAAPDRRRRVYGLQPPTAMVYTSRATNRVRG